MRSLLPPIAAVVVLTACTSASPPVADPTTGTSPSASPASSPAPAGTSTEPTRPSGSRFIARTSRIGPALRARMTASHRAGCPVPLSGLRHLTVSYVDFGGRSRTGELVVAAEDADGLVSVFRKLYAARWPIARMRLVDVYDGDDGRSMAADNTSAFNCRRVAGSDSWSEHAYGRAIDLNPVRNPYVQASTVDPPAGRAFASLDRSADAEVPPGVVKADDVVVRAFAAIGWTWGGDWSSSKDYQHFSASGR